MRSGWAVVLPFIEREEVFGAAVLLRNEKFDDEELQFLETLARDVSFTLRSLKMEEERKRTFSIIVDNLRQFEELADRLRNPLAIIKGYLEIRGEVDDETVLENIKKQTDRIEGILDELRAREMVTYEMKKALER
ncbi:MAG: hypothetical protein DRN91_08535 [Candidatus Alkanophagales archaeon]|nr:MAG: hypothetical protein DRN91_08535 [Candidatus Alkanophagales archaeon]